MDLLKTPSLQESAPSIGEVISLQDLARKVIHRKQLARRKLVSATAVAAALLLVIGYGIGNSLNDSGNRILKTNLASNSGIKIDLVEFEPNVMKVELQATEKGWGTQFQWNCIYTEIRTELQSPESYDLVVTDSSGAKTVVATWREIGEIAKGLGAATSIPWQNIRAVEIRATGTTEPVMRAEV